MRLASQILSLERQVNTLSLQLPHRPRNPTLDTTRNNIHNPDAKRRKLDSQRVAIRMQRSLGRIIRAAKHIRHDSRQTADLHDRATRSDHQRRKRSAHLHHREHIDVERRRHFVHVELHRWNSVVPSRAIDEVRQFAMRQTGNA